MAPKSRLETAIENANAAVDKASHELHTAMQVRNALHDLSGSTVTTAPNKPGRKPKGLPAEVKE